MRRIKLEMKISDRKIIFVERRFDIKSHDDIETSFNKYNFTINNFQLEIWLRVLLKLYLLTIPL